MHGPLSSMVVLPIRHWAVKPLALLTTRLHRVNRLTMPAELSCLLRRMILISGPTLNIELWVSLVPEWLTLSILRTTRCRRPDLLMMLNLMTFRALMFVVVRHTNAGSFRFLVLMYSIWVPTSCPRLTGLMLGTTKRWSQWWILLTLRLGLGLMSGGRVTGFLGMGVGACR